MALPQTPEHCGRPMAMTATALRCPGCGFELPGPGPEGLPGAPPEHCGAPMLLARSLACEGCGASGTDTVALGRGAPPPEEARLDAHSVLELKGKVWAGYRIVSEIAAGGMAIVYRAYQPGLERYVAIKFLLPPALPDPTLGARFRQEAQIVARLRHPNIVTVLNYGEDQGIAYLVMECVEGDTVFHRLGRPMEATLAVDVAGQMALALDFAHSQGVVHRDVKPSNILLGHDNWPLLTDFGLARILDSPTRLTPLHIVQRGMGPGTPEYMAPEQAQGGDVDARTDVYALGIVLFEMMTGRPPFYGEKPVDTMFKHVSEALPQPRSINPAIPPDLEAVIIAATEKKPARRFQSAAEMASALQSVRNRLSSGTGAAIETEGQGGAGGGRKSRWWQRS